MSGLQELCGGGEFRTLSRQKGGTQLQRAKFEDLALKGCSAQPGNSWQQSLHLN